MIRTPNLDLPIYNEPDTDVFDLQEWNGANTSIDGAYKEIIDFRTEIPKVNANAELVEARMGEATLGAKIGKVSSQLEEINNKKANDNEVRKKNVLITMSDVGQDVKTAMTGGSVAIVGKNAVLNENIVDGQVTFNKTNFMKFKLGTNKLKNQSVTNIGSRNWFEIYLEKGKSYNLNHKNGGHSGCAIDIYTFDKVTKLLSLVNWSLFNGSTGVGFSTTNIETGWYYLCFYVPTEEEANTTKYLTGFQINEGTTPVPYEDYKEDLTFNDNVDVSNNIKPKGINKEKTDFILVQNIGFTFKDGYTIDELTGFEAPSTSRKGDSSYKKIYPNSIYYLNFKCRIMFYDSDKKYISWINKDNDFTSRYITTPSNAEYMRINVASDFDKTNLVFILSDKEVKYEDAMLPTLNQALLLKSGVKSIFNGKKLTTDGDSITAQGLWQTYLQLDLGVSFLKNCGVGGTTVTNMCSDERVLQIPTETELLIIMGGTNDFSQNIELGNINSVHDNTTFYGAYQLWLDKIYAKIPNATVIIMTSPYKSNENTPNTKGFVLEDYRKATRDVAYKYGVHCIDLRKEMKINHLNYLGYIPDGTHPNMYGAKNMAEVIIGDIKNLYDSGYTIQYN